MIWPINNEAFWHEESFENAPGAQHHHQILVFDISLSSFDPHPSLPPKWQNYILPMSKDAGFYADFESDVGFWKYCVFD